MNPDFLQNWVREQGLSIQIWLKKRFDWPPSPDPSIYNPQEPWNPAITRVNKDGLQKDWIVGITSGPFRGRVAKIFNATNGPIVLKLIDPRLGQDVLGTKHAPVKPEDRRVKYIYADFIPLVKRTDIPLPPYNEEKAFIEEYADRSDPATQRFFNGPAP